LSLKVSLMQSSIVSISDNLNENKDITIHFNHKCQKNEQENILTIREIKNIEEKTGVVERQYKLKNMSIKATLFIFQLIYFLLSLFIF
ncbi:hypothetical protein ACMCHA_000523, partial [Campylobacter coli]